MFKKALFLALILFSSIEPAKCDWATCSSIGFCGTNTSLPVFGSGPAINIFDNTTSFTNAAMHIALATAIPIAGYKLYGDKGKLIFGLSWIALSLLQEAVFHTPDHPGAAYPSEVRSDLITRIIPTILILSF